MIIIVSEYIKDVIISAINSRRLISFEYINANDMIKRHRIGEPHALFNHNTTKNLTVDVYQTGGYSSSTSNIDDWRDFILDRMSNVIILEDRFEPRPSYNPNSDRYKNCLAKIDISQ